MLVLLGGEIHLVLILFLPFKIRFQPIPAIGRISSMSVDILTGTKF